ncbi:MAG: fluoride efflux transporter CrcB [Gammaproteobacteria bacterium]|nr:fluoride efflux transporter CrcB [Gammaproteobacteria bacterium]MDP2141188.1 fluoride efflux transporter CrcB [Gammaproteobacteria bacterium]MDP2349138.1 fluoride efflux transporter CrcB [Gammaproteobacteria bacterium]
MIYTLAVAAGGALGAVSRYWLVSAMGASRFPWGTLTVNVAGSVLIGVLYVLITEKAVLSEQWRALLVVGYLGAFTTFSTFSLDALMLLQDGRLLHAGLYVLGSVVICLLGAWLGIMLMRAI